MSAQQIETCMECGCRVDRECSAIHHDWHEAFRRLAIAVVDLAGLPSGRPSAGEG